ncbi:hypothetical protein BGW38_006530 [Lunasporangiospora selenospora]|uniref:VLRF1 domain-containing protein n=1 Tax=Lunasporangiospora selenospora TaxID=979761 RepID=A0A9P6FYZ9_9FUNG|nr:hypothetical protein BGW38_006530 [Lunasporangiospora selenospora]
MTSVPQPTDASRVGSSTAAALPASIPLYYLPQELLDSLVPVTSTEPDLVATSTTDSSTVEPPAVPTITFSLDSATPSCRVCGVAQFESVSQQREHFKLDWHRYNLKQQMLDKQSTSISEQQFEDMVQDLSSISGSDAGGVDESDENTDANDVNVDSQDEETASAAAGDRLTAVNSNSGRRKGKKTSRGSGTHTPGSQSRLNEEDAHGTLIHSLMKKLELTVQENKSARHQDPVMAHQQQVLERQLEQAKASPLVWFTSAAHDKNVRLGVYKSALPNRGQCDDVKEYLRGLQYPPDPVKRKGKRRGRRNKIATDPNAERDSAASQANEHGDRGSEDADEEAEEDGAEDDEEEEEEEEGLENYDTMDWVEYQMRAKQQELNAEAEAEAEAPPSAEQPVVKPRYWTLIMLGGGHFAGLVMDLAGQYIHNRREQKTVAHKTFHRYTVRRKQGGSQAAHGIANSAGARVRMYNEEALKLEVRQLLDNWSPWINESECVFVHAAGGNNRRVLFYDGSVISAAARDGRLRSIPFLTRRPTLTELKRAFEELSSVKVSNVTMRAIEQLEREEQEAFERALESKAALELSKEEQQQQQGQQEKSTIPEATPELLKAIELVKKGRGEALSSHLQRHQMDASALLPVTTSSEYDTRRTPTLLHLASHHGQISVVKALLERHHVDPTVTSSGSNEGDSGAGASSATAYDIAKDKETRNVFRRAMALMPDAWDWIGLAHVPSALTPEMEAEQERKTKERSRKVLEAERERKRVRDANRPTTPVGSTSSNSPATESKSSSASLMARNMAAASAANSHLSPELRMRLERERRAQAAEARIAAMREKEQIRRSVQEGKNVCVACGKSLEELVAFEKFGRKFCTTDCVAKGPA